MHPASLAMSGVGRFCCKSILELGRARARRTRFLPRPLSRMENPARPLSAEDKSISSAIYQTSERILQQNRHRPTVAALEGFRQLTVIFVPCWLGGLDACS